MFTLFALSLFLLTPATAQLANVYSSCSRPNVVALAFDDGPYIYQSQLMQMFKDAGIKGTFFFNGQNYRCIYDDASVSSVKAAYAAGHEIGSHTWRHADLATLTSNQINDEMARVELALKRIIGVTPALMRPPYGNYNDLVRKVSAMRNQSLITWDFDSGDSIGSTAQQSIAAYGALANRRPSSVLTLNHETYATTVGAVIPAAINSLRNAGYHFVTVSECLGIPAYQSISEPQSRTADWVCK
ncbi:glycoside hydrolase/deacetylase [Gautieria morchelliformis]|nr:glycoside hydrolase/deacetylase [Gautieria morchelliformis]